MPEESTEKKKVDSGQSQGDLLAHNVYIAAQDLFDNRLGRGDIGNLYAQKVFWANLSAALYGENDSRTIELRITRRR